MIKMYHISTPEQLKELNQYAKGGDAASMAAVWASKLRKDGKTPWDNIIFAVFETHMRKAWIGRKLGEGMTVNTTLKYTPSLRWCEENLERTE